MNPTPLLISSDVVGRPDPLQEARPLPSWEKQDRLDNTVSPPLCNTLLTLKHQHRGLFLTAPLCSPTCCIHHTPFLTPVHVCLPCQTELLKAPALFIAELPHAPTQHKA